MFVFKSLHVFWTDSGTNPCISTLSIMVWTVMTGCWGWCVVEWRSAPSMLATSRPKPVSYLASALRGQAHALMCVAPMMMARWPTLWRQSRWAVLMFVVVVDLLYLKPVISVNIWIYNYIPIVYAAHRLFSSMTKSLLLFKSVALYHCSGSSQVYR